MAATLSDLSEMLEERGFNFQIDSESGRIHLGFETQHYRDLDGDLYLPVYLEIQDAGELIYLCAPGLYYYLSGPNREAVFQACMMAHWDARLVRYEYDTSDGEIRVGTEIVVEDTRLTLRQLDRTLRTVVKVIDEVDPVIRLAIDTGQVTTRSVLLRTRSRQGAAATQSDLSTAPAWFPDLDGGAGLTGESEGGATRNRPAEEDAPAPQRRRTRTTPQADTAPPGPRRGRRTGAKKASEPPL